MRPEKSTQFKSHNEKNIYMKTITEYRPWGKYQILADATSYKVKEITVNPSGRLSLQYHHYRSEAWTIISGVATITLGTEIITAKAGETIQIPVTEHHRVENKTTRSLVFIEVQTGTYFGEDDIVRIEDDYNRL